MNTFRSICLFYLPLFEDGHFEYIQEHLFILSAFYGVLKAMDGVTPYRLEMKAKACIHGRKNLYEFWGSDLYKGVRDDSGIIINLASKEYSKCIEKYLTKDDRYITITFCEKSGNKLVTKGTYAKMARGEMVRFMAYSKCIEKYLTKDDRYITITFCEKSGNKLVTKGTYAKMARGEMVRFMAEKHIENPVEIQKFDRLGYVFRDALSSESEYVFERVAERY